MLTSRSAPIVPFLNVEDVPATGFKATIKSVAETSQQVKETVENAKEFTVFLTVPKSDRFPEGQACRMFDGNSPLAKELSALSGQKQTEDGTNPIDETRLSGKIITFVRTKSLSKKFSNVDTLTIKR